MDFIQVSLSLTLNWYLFTGTGFILASCNYVLKDHPFILYAKSSEKLAFLTTCVYQYYLYNICKNPQKLKYPSRHLPAQS